MKRNSPALIEEINSALKNLMWGSVEIIVQDKTVTQITVKNIKKTKVSTSQDDRNAVARSKSVNKVLTNKKQKYINVLTS